MKTMTLCSHLVRFFTIFFRFLIDFSNISSVRSIPGRSAGLHEVQSVSPSHAPKSVQTSHRRRTNSSTYRIQTHKCQLHGHNVARQRCVLAGIQIIGNFRSAYSQWCSRPIVGMTRVGGRFRSRTRWRASRWRSLDVPISMWMVCMSNQSINQSITSANVARIGLPDTGSAHRARDHVRPTRSSPLRWPITSILCPCLSRPNQAPILCGWRLSIIWWVVLAQCQIYISASLVHGSSWSSRAEAPSERVWASGERQTDLPYWRNVLLFASFQTENWCVLLGHCRYGCGDMWTSEFGIDWLIDWQIDLSKLRLTTGPLRDYDETFKVKIIKVRFCESSLLGFILGDVRMLLKWWVFSLRFLLSMSNFPIDNISLAIDESKYESFIIPVHKNV